MTTTSVRFEDFELDAGNRQLRRGAEPVELNGRYFDALALLVGEPGRLVTKDRFMDEVWRGVPVTDEALTQCIRTLRRQLGDDASRPRFIETVPKHGYRFIAPLHGEVAKIARPVSDHDWSTFMRLGIMGTAGAGVAGIIGGLFYGFLGANGPELGGISVLLVLLVLTTVLAVIGGAGVSFGIATIALTRSQPWYWPILGGAIGGTLVGAVVRLLGVDALHLLFGNSPGNMTGALEGAMLGAATGLGFIIASRREKLRIGAPLAALCGAFAGFAIFRLGWHLMGGSLNQLVEHFPGAQLVLPGLFGEDRLGPASEMVTAALEGFLFSGCVVCAMLLAKRNAKA